MTSISVLNVLKEQHVKVVGELKEIQTMNDGTKLMKDDSRFYKVSSNRIKVGFFRKGRFRYSPKNIIVFIN
jgi:hypothetical protein